MYPVREASPIDLAKAEHSTNRRPIVHVATRARDCKVSARRRSIRARARLQLVEFRHNFGIWKLEILYKVSTADQTISANSGCSAHKNPPSIRIARWIASEYSYDDKSSFVTDKVRPVARRLDERPVLNRPNAIRCASLLKGVLASRANLLITQ